MKERPTPSLFISANQEYQYRMMYPYYLAIDERFVHPDWPSRNPHWHDHFEIEIILDGSGTHLFNGSRFPLGPGCAYLFTPMDIHALIPDTDTSLHLIHIRFDDQAITEEVRHELLRHEHSCPVRFDGVAFDRLLTQFNELTKCFEDKSTYQELNTKLILSYLCLYIIQQSQPNIDRFHGCDITNPVVHQTMLYILYNFRKEITMQNLGKQAHVSPNHLAVLFKQTLGTTCMQLVADLRMQHAVKLLENTTLTIEEIAEKSGFSSVSYFISMFRKKYNTTPKEYQIREKAHRLDEEKHKKEALR